MSEIEAVDLEKKTQKNGNKQRNGRSQSFKNNDRKPFNKRFNSKQPFRNQVCNLIYQQKPQQFRQQKNQSQRFRKTSQVQNSRQDQQYQSRYQFRKTGRNPIQKQQSNQNQPKQSNARPKPNVIIKGLDSYSDEKLMELCKTYGPMDLCLMERDNFGNLRPEGIGLVAFEKLEYASNCVQALNGATMSFGDQESQYQNCKISAKVVGQVQATEENKGSIKILRQPIKKANQYLLFVTIGIEDFDKL